jgi:TPR repeat protein
LADDGNADGQYGYGWCLSIGFGVAKNESEAARYCKLSADQGNARGQYGYGRCLARGFGVVKDENEAAHYYKLSADQGGGPVRFDACLVA